jgi:hypothetical protein
VDFEQLVWSTHQTHDYLKNREVSAVNQSLTIRDWLFGYYIVEYELKGKDRAKYGDMLLVEWPRILRRKVSKGCHKETYIASVNFT